mmetsp:Transcript_28303/g.62171  ORF Transcript_28303/g.62171 Transcript_28303/m.62171 type:complete len:153 (-) Transcript_28303:107-565(-)
MPSGHFMVSEGHDAAGVADVRGAAKTSFRSAPSWVASGTAWTPPTTIAADRSRNSSACHVGGEDRPRLLVARWWCSMTILGAIVGNSITLSWESLTDFGVGGEARLDETRQLMMTEAAGGLIILRSSSSTLVPSSFCVAALEMTDDDDTQVH